ncbi:MAG TPA: metallophosphoesterase [Pyrinomonadaceae bacterium]|jgi:3',5'-cyclic AMP phosphodiesterase CpdA|nr:metallophosphoesterase [Pyrinomonadaceae bacterium]
MRRIVHLSDLHFGAIDAGIVDCVVDKVNALAPDVVVVSGDLTQRAKSREFIDARTFLDRLPTPQIVVPGNHDIPAHNLFARFVTPLEKYCHYITDDLSPTFFDEELAIVGLNTARSNVVKGGRINQDQIDLVRSSLCALGEQILKVVVTHHPFDLPANSHHSDVVGRANEAMAAVAACGGDVLLAGHLHVSHIDTTAKRYALGDGTNALVIQAGTATSTRVRGEPHSFNFIEFDEPRLNVTRLESRKPGEPFAPAEIKRYRKSGNGWLREEV